MKCDKCGKVRRDVLKRLFLGEVLIRYGFFEYRNDIHGNPMCEKDGEKIKFSIDPALCTSCCAEMPGRAWMKQGVAAEEAHVA